MPQETGTNIMLNSELLSFVRPIVEKAATSIGPVESAEILPAEAYISEKFWEFEKEVIFNREWLCVGHVNEVANCGDHLPVTVVDEPALLVRDEQGVVRVLSAICRHRGHPIVGGVADRDRSAPCLNSRRLICPYHNWTYGLDGRLIGAPSMDETTPVTQLRKTVRLPEFKSEVFHGLVFVNFDESAKPLARRLTKLDRELSTYPLHELRPSHTLAQTDLKWNWKLHHENALEPYHTDYVHKGLHASVPSHLTKFCKFETGDGQVMRSTGFLEHGGDLYQEKGRSLPEIPGLTEEQRNRVTFVSIMPTVVAVLQPSSVILSVLNARSAGIMEMRRVILYPKDAFSHGEFKRISEENFERMKVIMMQDMATQAALQQAYKSRYAPRGRFARLEAAIPQLNQWAVERYRSALAQE
jgi:phenylpropionate dioxygenase-like ring-hydroxylating dioxygenase large terminal subunit